MTDADDIVRIVHAQANARYNAEGVITLGALIDALQNVPAALPVYLMLESAPMHAGKLHSWRGNYQHLTIAPGSDPCTAGALLDRLRGAVGATFCGYKGGEFIMNRDTYVFADARGECTTAAIIKVVSVAECAMLMTKRLRYDI